MLRAGEKSQRETAELFKVDRSTISRMMTEVRERIAEGSALIVTARFARGVGCGRMICHSVLRGGLVMFIAWANRHHAVFEAVRY
jgi:hypothetical protein